MSAPDDRWTGEIRQRHDDAIAAGAPGYVDPSSGLFVLTAASLRARGACCGSGCRHCPYPGEACAVGFRPMSIDDLPLLQRWLGRPHVRRWWRDPATAEAVAAKYLPRIRGTAPTEMHVITEGGVPVGFLQRYRIDDHPAWARVLARSGHAAACGAGIDFAIGEPDRTGTGIGTRAISAYRRALFERWPDVDQILVTPQAANRASCRALEKAGFRLVWTGILDSDDPADTGPAALHVALRGDAADPPLGERTPQPM